MSLTNGAALLWLIPLGGIIVLLYLLKMRRRDLKVPATFLWPALTYEVRANSLFQKLRLSWLLFLQLLALVLIVLGLAHPQVARRGLGGEVTILVIDTSASMSATDVAPSRLAEAKKLALSALDAAQSSDRLCLIEAGPTPKVAFPLSGDVAGIRRAIKELDPSDCDSDMGEALRLAASLTSKQERARIVLYSDGVFPEVRNFAPGKAKVVFQKVGNTGDNVAIYALGTTDAPNGRLLFCGLKNYGKLPSLGVLKFTADGNLFNSVRVEVPQNGTLGKTLEVPAGARVIEATLECEDVLKSDNYAVVLNDPGAVVKTLLVGSGDLFLERALALDPRVTLDKAAELPNKVDYDLVVFDGVEEKETKAKGVLTFGRAGTTSPVQRLGTVETPSFVSAEEAHPVMASVDLQGMYVGSAEKVKPKNQGQVLAVGSQGPWVVAATGNQRHIYVAFDPLHSDFPLLAAFPIFISNAIDFLVPRASSSGALAVPAGRAFSLPAMEDKPLSLVAPDGKRTEIKPIDGTYVVREARRVGRYELTNGKTKQDIYSSFSSESESNIAPVDRVILGSSEVAAATKTWRLADFWRPLLLLGLLVLAGEWVLFARRS